MVDVPSESHRLGLFTDLEQQSRGVYEQIRDGTKYGVVQHEETITESFLLKLAKSQPNVAIRTFTKYQESRESGADWEWWWEGDRR